MSEKIKAVRPLADWILIAMPKFAEKVTAAGVIMPDTARQDKLIEARVVAVGPGRWVRSLRSASSHPEVRDWSWQREPLSVEPGDVVMVDDAIRTVANFPQFRLAGFESEEAAETLHLVKEDALRCKIAR